ncbi:MAG: hypothetical protein M3O70_27095, partial [Actinomycetota bacterium]|nr:hypothetical protein [Actinomycetota bacterium]
MRPGCSLNRFTAVATATGLLMCVALAGPAAASNHDRDSGGLQSGAGVVLDDVADTATVVAGHGTARGGG